MNNHASTVAPSTAVNRLNFNQPSRFVQRFTHAAAVRARHAAAPTSSLWNPHLLDRLHAPLTRYRD